MSGAFTPGPWVDNLHHEKRDGGRFYVHVTAAALVPIACVPTGVEGFGHDEGRANARLIAAAPDLFAALEALIDAIDFEGSDASIRFNPSTAWELESLRGARAALAKVTAV